MALVASSGIYNRISPILHHQLLQELAAFGIFSCLFTLFQRPMPLMLEYIDGVREHRQLARIGSRV